MEILQYKNIGIDDWKIGQSNDILATVLGSCVSVCLWDSQLKIGGMNHYLLPERKEDYLMGRTQGRIMDSQRILPLNHKVIDDLMQGMLQAGADLRNTQALVVGGSEFNYDHFKVGKKNIEIALSLLKQYQITDVQVSGGGEFSRNIKFYISEGRVVIHKLPLGSPTKGIEEIIYLGGKWK